MDCCCCSVNVTPYENTANEKTKKAAFDYRDVGCCGCIQRRLHILPIVSVVWFGISLVTTYAISVSLGHTEAGFPYISHAAVGTPETNIFAQMINIGAVLMIDVSYRNEKTKKAAFDYRDVGCCGCIQRRLHILPIVSVVWFGISLVTTYAISVSLGHTEAGFPYISHAAVGTPETNIFAQMINIGAVLIILNAVIRYLYIKNVLFHHTSSRGWFRANMTSFVFGILTAVGFSMVANFQTDNIKSVHYIGAGLGLGGGTVYCWIQTFITWKLYRRELHRGNIAILQTVNSMALVLLLFMFGISKVVYNTQKAANMGTKHDTLQSVYLVSTISEWLSVILLNTFLLTFISDFRAVKLKSPQIYQLVKTEDYSEKVAVT